MKSRTLYFSLWLTCITTSSMCIAQEIEGNDAQQNLLKIGTISVEQGIIRKFDNRYEGVVGSPFYYEEWLEGTVVMENDRIIDDIKIKYNMYEDELIVLQPKSLSYYIDKKGVRSFTLQFPDGRKDIFKKYQQIDKPEQSQYFRAVYMGKINLWEHTKVIFEKANYQGGYSSDKKYDEFKQYSELYYTSAGMQNPAKIKSTSNAISKIFPDNGELIKEFIKSNLLDLRKKENIVRIFEFYEQL